MLGRFGAEVEDLACLMRERWKVLVGNPTYGQVASLNVAVATALACREIARRRNA